MASWWWWQQNMARPGNHHKAVTPPHAGCIVPLRTSPRPICPRIQCPSHCFQTWHFFVMRFPLRFQSSTIALWRRPRGWCPRRLRRRSVRQTAAEVMRCALCTAELCPLMTVRLLDPSAVFSCQVFLLLAPNPRLNIAFAVCLKTWFSGVPPHYQSLCKIPTVGKGFSVWAIGPKTEKRGIDYKSWKKDV